jgi:hypothetical protein
MGASGRVDDAIEGVSGEAELRRVDRDFGRQRQDVDAVVRNRRANPRSSRKVELDPATLCEIGELEYRDGGDAAGVGAVDCSRGAP